MAHVSTDDGVRLHSEEAGRASRSLFVHEFAGDHRSWEPQLRALRAPLSLHRLRRARLSAVRRARGRGRATRRRARSTTSSPCSTGSASSARTSSASRWAPSPRCTSASATRARAVARRRRRAATARSPSSSRQFRAESGSPQTHLRARAPREVATRYALGPARVQFQNKDPRGWAEFAAQLAEHSSLGLGADDARRAGRPARRCTTSPESCARIEVPTLLIAGDEDEGCLEPTSCSSARSRPRGSRSCRRPATPSTSRSPSCSTRLLERFFADVENGAWGRRDPRSLATSTTGMDER